MDIDGELTIGVVGTGAMGRGIAQIAAAAGVRVLLLDARPGAADEALASIGETLSRLAQRGRIDAAARDAAVARMAVVSDAAALAPCQVVVEAIVEDLQAKRDLFRALEAVVREDCILATNTSSLSVTAIAAGCRRPGRVAGWHFFNPVPLMKVVEVVDGLLTEDNVSEALMGLASRMGHRAVRCKDTPGFIVNHAGRAYGTEALRILGEGIADFPEIDCILREAAGFRMGPFELLDLTGLDVSHPVMESIYDQYYQEPRYRPSPITRQRLAAGLLGRKSGRGFYRYEDGKMQAQTEPLAPDARPARVWVSGERREARVLLVDLLARLGAKLDDGARPADDALCLVTPLGHDATTTALAQGLDPQRTVALDTLFGLDRRRTLMPTPVTDANVAAAAWGLLASDGIPVTLIHDSPGFVAQRVAAMIVSIGCDMCQQRIATPEDVDQAVTLGLGYPKGPLSMGDAIGPGRVLAILEALHDFYRDPRYRPSPWLIRRARLGVSLLTPEH